MSAPRLPWLMLLLALLLAPLAMIGGGQAMAHSAPHAAAGHCAETETPAEAPPPAPIDCMIACAGCLPALAAPPGAPPPPEAAAGAAPLAFRLHGLHPEAAIPPPRSS